MSNNHRKSGVETEEVLERWCFDVDTDQQVLETG
jgi:hypothetical protein